MKEIDINSDEFDVTEYEAVNSRSINDTLNAIDTILKRIGFQIEKGSGGNTNYLGIVAYDNLEKIVDEFHRGEEEDEWARRTITSLANHTRLSTAEVQDVLSEHPDMFPTEGSRNTTYYTLNE